MLSFEGNASLFWPLGQLFQMKPVSGSQSAGLVRGPRYSAPKKSPGRLSRFSPQACVSVSGKSGRLIFVPCPPKLEVTSSNPIGRATSEQNCAPRQGFTRRHDPPFEDGLAADNAKLSDIVVPRHPRRFEAISMALCAADA
jgi:hypothetical protein